MTPAVSKMLKGSMMQSVASRIVRVSQSSIPLSSSLADIGTWGAFEEEDDDDDDEFELWHSSFSASSPELKAKRRSAKTK
jgi:hypothetical protein